VALFEVLCDIFSSDVVSSVGFWSEVG
jgi:hypothetical protein